MTTESIIIQIPFAGFYESIHSSEIDHAYDSLISDDDGEPIESLQDDLWMNATSDPYLPYAKEYAESLNDYIEHEHDAELGLKFESVESPKYYNYSTDRIFCTIPEASLFILYNETPRAILEKVIHERFTSCDGFISSYSNDLDQWPTLVTDWDHNELMTLLEAWLISKGEDLNSIDYSVCEYGNLYEAAMRSVDETMSPELVALCDKAYAMRA